MNRNEAKRLSENITNEELLAMLKNVKEKFVDWNSVSAVNKGMSKGVAWNILAADFDVNQKYNHIIKFNMIREFGDFLPNYLKPQKKIKEKINIVHQTPNFTNYE